MEAKSYMGSKKNMYKFMRGFIKKIFNAKKKSLAYKVHELQSTEVWERIFQKHCVLAMFLYSSVASSLIPYLKKNPGLGSSWNTHSCDTGSLLCSLAHMQVSSVLQLL